MQMMNEGVASAAYMLPLQALQDTRHLIEHHSSLVAKGVTTLVAAVVPAVDALRSQTAHAALLTLQARPPSWQH